MASTYLTNSSAAERPAIPAPIMIVSTLVSGNRSLI